MQSVAQVIRLGHSADADDAFMFWGLSEQAASVTRDDPTTSPLRFEHVITDIETLNQWALEGRLEFTAISAHAYAYVHKKYILLSSGGSFGLGWGPVVVAKSSSRLSDLAGQTIAVPGKLTTAYLLLRLALPDFTPIEMPFDKILDAVAGGSVPAGLLIHEGQLSHPRYGLHKVCDLGEWWAQETDGLPVPLGLNAVHRDLGEATVHTIARLFREGIERSLAHRQEALVYAAKYSRGLEEPLLDRFVGMYVNDYTMDMREKGQTSLRLLYERGYKAGLLPEPVPVEVIS